MTGGFPLHCCNFPPSPFLIRTTISSFSCRFLHDAANVSDVAYSKYHSLFFIRLLNLCGFFSRSRWNLTQMAASWGRDDGGGGEGEGGQFEETKKNRQIHAVLKFSKVRFGIRCFLWRHLVECFHCFQHWTKRTVAKYWLGESTDLSNLIGGKVLF